MRLLIVDNSTESQALCAKRVEGFGQSDVEMLDLRVKLVGERDYADRLQEADVLVLGSGLGERAVGIARHANSLTPWVHIVMFVSDEAYGGGAFRTAHSAGVRKVFPDSASPLDFLQELVAIHADFRREGRAREGKLVTVVHAKGGVGATTVTAALAEVCDVFHRKTMLWDLDIETRDLSRGLTVNGVEAKVVTAWVNGTREISRDSLKDALIPISGEVSVLMPPDRLGESVALVGELEHMNTVQRVVELARVMFDVILVDTAGRLGPATGALIRQSDTVLVVIDDTVLGCTAVDLFLERLQTLAGDPDRIAFLVYPATGSFQSVSQIAQYLEPAHKLGDAPWRLPPIPHDPKGATWPGSTRTLYGLGQRQTRDVLEQVAEELGLISNANDKGAGQTGGGAAQKGGDSWLNKIFGRKGAEAAKNGPQSGNDGA